MTYFIKKENQWKESIPFAKTGSLFKEPLDHSVKHEGPYKIFHGLSKLRLAITATSNTNISFTNGYNTGSRFVKPRKATRIQGGVETPINIVTTVNYITFPSGTYEVELELRGGESIQMSTNSIVTAVTDLSEFRGSSFPSTRSTSLVSVPDVLPQTVRSLNQAFYGCTKFNQPLPWDTSNVAMFNACFYGCTIFNQPLDWDVRSGIVFDSMLQNCVAFNRPINFSTDKLASFSSFLQGCSAFNSAFNLNAPNTTNMYSALSSCTQFNQPVTLNMVNVNNIAYMFYNCSNFNSMFECNSVKLTSTLRLFSGCSKFNQPVNLDVSKATNMSYTFHGCSVFNQPLPWDTASSMNMNYMFQNAPKFNQDLSGWTVDLVEYWTGFNSGATLLTSAKIPAKFR